MDVDPIDDGPRILTAVPPADAATTTTPASTTTIQMIPITTPEQAKQRMDQLRSADDWSQRVQAAHQLDAIAAVLGPERTKEVSVVYLESAKLSTLLTHSHTLSLLLLQELIPFLIDGMEDEDEVLLAVATSLGRMLPTVDYESSYLWRPLELLLSLEDATVRAAAVASSRTLLEYDNNKNDSTTNNSADTTTALCGALVQRLAAKEWFTARCSAAALVSAVYDKTKTNDNGGGGAVYVQLLSQLCRDTVPMVRRVAAQQLGTMAQSVVEKSPRTAVKDELPNTIVPLLEELAATDQPDSVRLQTTENCVKLGRVCHDEAIVQRILPLIVATIEDRSWRVRWTAASKFADVMAAYAPAHYDTLVPAYERLLQDPEAEVRTAATFNLAHVARTPAIAERLAQKVTTLTENDSEHVRAALAAVATQLAPALGMDATITYLVPPVLLLLRDAASQVRLNVIASLHALNQVIGVDLLSQSLLPAILDLGADRQWRIRAAMMHNVKALAEQLGQEFFTDRLCALCLGWLGDPIARIRSAAAETLAQLTTLFGPAWALDHLVPAVLQVREHASYLRRLTALQALARIGAAWEEESLVQEHVLPVVLDMSTDVVPNIRFNVAKELQTMAPRCGVLLYTTKIVPILTVLAEDEDRDVRHHAVTATQQLQDVFGC